ncbi:hypothetical protein [Streptomyces paradoxus]|uniref:hypothetical protein n=1 Tax=Streptomyces paradoxus TaxID=66375 RepID=UPI00382A3B65
MVRTVFDDAIARIDAIKEALGTLPDVGATRAEEHLAERFNLVVHAGTAAELARRGHLPVVGEHKGYPLYCGLALENCTDRRKVARASTAGQLHMRDAAARILGLRASDFDHLIRAGLLAHADTARSGWNKHDASCSTARPTWTGSPEATASTGMPSVRPPRATGPRSAPHPEGGHPMTAKAGTDWYDEVAAGWAARQRAEDDPRRHPRRPDGTALAIGTRAR